MSAGKEPGRIVDGLAGVIQWPGTAAVSAGMTGTESDRAARELARTTVVVGAGMVSRASGGADEDFGGAGRPAGATTAGGAAVTGAGVGIALDAKGSACFWRRLLASGGCGGVQTSAYTCNMSLLREGA